MAKLSKNGHAAITITLLFFTVAAVVADSLPPPAALVPAIIAFGDSTVDVGNNNYILNSTFKANFPPYGRDFKNHKATGRFCNGKIVTDITADTLGFTSYVPPYLSPEVTGDNLLLGANFASAGSGYFDGTSNLYNAISLSQQLKYYKEYQSKLAKVVGSTKASSILSNALYILSTGSGDFVQNYFINPNLYKSKSPSEFSSLLVGIFSNVINELYKLGARKVGVTSLPPLGCLPATIQKYGHRRGECISRLNDYARDFNTKLEAAVNSSSRLFPELRIVIFDIYKPLYDLATAPTKHGFVEARRDCCGTGTVETRYAICKANELNGTCRNATGYVFWDGVHPSEAANNVLADSFLMQGIKLIV
ncbi:GDSL esterase/lipase APG-like [Typha latifolia]|uniref:GDSL esterase/lipase APG-like n=1 Tax=Typha latifolia TaxID=4733 RepID=UPI003C2B7CF7